MNGLSINKRMVLTKSLIYHEIAYIKIYVQRGDLYVFEKADYTYKYLVIVVI